MVMRMMKVCCHKSDGNIDQDDDYEDCDDRGGCYDDVNGETYRGTNDDNDDDSNDSDDKDEKEVNEYSITQFQKSGNTLSCSKRKNEMITTEAFYRGISQKFYRY